MSGLKFEQQVEVRKAVADYVKKHGVTSLRDIAEYVYNQTGIRPSASTIARLVRGLGYSQPKQVRPSWKWEKVKWESGRR